MNITKFLYIYLGIINIILPESSYGQGQTDFANDFKLRRDLFLQNKLTTSPSPEASAIGKFGDFKVNTFTGLPSISIPLYELKGSELSMAFSLSYEGGGNKVEQVPTWVGLGWTLNGGGVISRSVKGDPDLKSNYFSKDTIIKQSLTTAYSNEFTENNFLEDISQHEIEAQPDIFHLNVGGISAKFFFKANKELVMTESKDILIIPYWSSDDDIDYLQVKDAIGNSYWFLATEETTLTFPQNDNWPRFNTNFTFNSSWFLTLITNSNTTESIELSYISEASAYNPYQYSNQGNYWSRTFSSGNQTDCVVTVQCPCGTTAADNFGTPVSTSIVNRKYLNEINLYKGTTKIEKLKFHSVIATTCLGSARRLDKISFWKGSGAVNEIINNSFFYSCGTNRLTLDSIKEVSANPITSKPPYIFTYNTTQLPLFTSNSIDHWGYYNGAGNGTFPTNSVIPLISCPDFWSDNSNCSNMNIPASGADRNPNVNFAKSSILEKIMFPTKGFIQFEWELNKALTVDLCGSNNQERFVGGLRIKSIKTFDSPGQLLTQKLYNYTTSGGISSGILFYEPQYINRTTFRKYLNPGELCSSSNFGFFCPSITFYATSRVGLGTIQGGLVGYSRVEEEFIGKTVYHYKNYLPGQNAWSLLNEFDIQDLGQLVLKEEFDASGKKLHSSGYKYSFNTSESRRSKSFYGLIVEAMPNQTNELKLCRTSPTTTIWKLSQATSPSCSEEKTYQSRWMRRHYLISQDWIYLKETTDTTFYNNGLSAVPKLITNTFGNDSVSSPTLIEMTNSDNLLYSKITRYPHDMGVYPLKSELLNRRMYAVPIEQENKVGGAIAYKSKIHYNTFLSSTGLQSGGGSWLLPSGFSERFASGQDSLKEIIDRYDLSGTHVQEAHKVFDQPATLLFSQNNTAASAKIQNASFIECAYSGFDSQDAVQGNWTISTPANITAGGEAKTGLGYWGGSGTLSKSGLPAGKYFLSYWLNNHSSALAISGTTTNTVQVSSSVDPNLWRFVQHTITVTANATVTVTGVSGKKVDEIRLYPSDALMTSFTYNSTNRLLSGSADENSLAHTFNYDPLLRLIGVLNFDMNYLKKFEYNYKTTSTENSVKSWEVLKDNVNIPTSIDPLSGGDVRRVFDYFDDLGRPMQNIMVAQSPSTTMTNDIITHHAYDPFGREVNQHLPFVPIAVNNGNFLTNAEASQVTFYNNQFSGEGNFAKTLTEYENSPLNRILKITQPGEAFNSKPINYTYGCNTGAMEVRNYRSSNTWYGVNKLHKQVVKNENGDSTVTYTDLIGLKIMEARNTIKTYFLYDDRQNLIQVIQPEAADLGHSTSNLINSSPSISNGSFVYVYDPVFNLLTSKKIPSGGTYTYLYDRLYREVLKTDPKGFKFFTKYDKLGRVCMTGRLNSAIVPANDSLFEVPSSLIPNHFYTSQSFPTSGFEPYTINYYDDYDWEDNGSDDISYTTTTIANYPTSNYPWVRGKPTRTRNGTLKQDDSAPTVWIDDYTFYDIFGREIQHRTAHHLSGTDISWMQYDFPGRLLRSRLSHNSTINTVNTNKIINQRFTYDHAGRVINNYHQIGDVAGDEKLISKLSYNDREELSLKQLAYNGTQYAQSIAYQYNIRKWLTQINDPSSTTSPALFSQRLYYHNPLGTSGAAPLFNGNITMSEWRVGANSTVNGVTRPLASYGYNYDGLDRLLSASYKENNAAPALQNFTVNNISYDKNGNLKTMTRNGQLSAGNYGMIDNLTYTYDANNPNRISSISDAASTGTQGFRSGTGGVYTYDDNGNMIYDQSKGIAVISYNHLNLPRKFTFASGNTIEMTYDALGTKLSKVVKQGATPVLSQDYIGSIEYHGGKLQSIYHSEGRVAFCDGTQTLSISSPIHGETKNFKAGTITAANSITGLANVTMQASTSILFQPGFQVEQGSNYTSNIESPPCAAAISYEYVIRDHLGNGRVYFADYNGNGTIQDATELLQEGHYDPWGLLLGGSWVNNSSIDNLYQYNEKELNNDFGLGLMDFGARWYDGSIGRWTTIDPMALERHWISPFNYVQNNPIIRVDPSGAFDFVQSSTGAIRWDKDANSQETTKSGETYLGKNLTFKFISTITQPSDVPFGSFTSGDKLTSTINLSATEDADGNLTSVNVKSNYDVSRTGGVFQGRNYFPGLGENQNQSIDIKDVRNFSEVYEQHASVHAFEALGLNLMGYDIVNVAQKLNLNLSGNNLSVSAATDVFPSAHLSVNNRQLFNYSQPSFNQTHRNLNTRTGDNGMGGSMVAEKIKNRPEPSFYQRYKN